MFRYKFLYILFLSFMFLPAIVSAQIDDDNPPPDHFEEAPPPRRPNLLRELNLTADQVKQIQQINQSNREKVRETQDLKRSAEKLLDEAIYADVPDEVLIKERLQKVEQIQLELMRLRTLTEFSVRKILTPEQLVRFRALRQDFLQRRGDMDDRRHNRNQPRRDKFRNKLKSNRNPPEN